MLKIIFFLSACNMLCKDVLEATADCKAHGDSSRPSSYEDCAKLNAPECQTLCCYLTGINADKTTYKGCIAMNQVFAGKHLVYESNTLKGTLVCEENYNKGLYYSAAIINILYVFLLI